MVLCLIQKKLFLSAIKKSKAGWIRQYSDYRRSPVTEKSVGESPAVDYLKPVDSCCRVFFGFLRHHLHPSQIRRLCRFKCVHVFMCYWFSRLFLLAPTLHSNTANRLKTICINFSIPVFDWTLHVAFIRSVLLRITFGMQKFIRFFVY